MSVIEPNKIYKLSEAADLLRVSKSTLRIWDKDGYFVAGRTRGEHRVYIGQQLIEMQHKMFKFQSTLNK